MKIYELIQSAIEQKSLFESEYAQKNREKGIKPLQNSNQRFYIHFMEKVKSKIFANYPLFDEGFCDNLMKAAIFWWKDAARLESEDVIQKIRLVCEEILRLPDSLVYKSSSFPIELNNSQKVIMTRGIIEILKLESVFFQRMLQGGMKEQMTQNLTLPQIDKAVFENIVQMILVKKLKINPDVDAFELLEAIDFLEIPFLQKLLIPKLIEEIMSKQRSDLPFLVTTYLTLSAEEKEYSLQIGNACLNRMVDLARYKPEVRDECNYDPNVSKEAREALEQFNRDPANPESVYNYDLVNCILFLNEKKYKDALYTCMSIKKAKKPSVNEFNYPQAVHAIIETRTGQTENGMKINMSIPLKFFPENLEAEIQIVIDRVIYLVNKRRNQISYDQTFQNQVRLDVYRFLELDPKNDELYFAYLLLMYEVEVAGQKVVTPPTRLRDLVDRTDFITVLNYIADRCKFFSDWKGLVAIALNKIFEREPNNFAAKLTLLQYRFKNSPGLADNDHLANEILQIDPNNSIALFFKGLIKIWQEDELAAIRSMKQALNIDPRLPDKVCLEGFDCYMEVGRLLGIYNMCNLARQYISKVNDSYEKSKGLCILAYKEKASNAQSLFGDCLVKYTNLPYEDPEFQYFFGLSLRDKGRHSEAFDLLKTAYEKISNNVYYLLSYSDLLIEKNKVQSARLLYKEFISRFPNEGKAYYGLSRTYASDNEVNERISFLQRAIELSPEYPDSYMELGNIYISDTKIKSWSMAKQYFEKGIALHEELYGHIYYFNRYRSSFRSLLEIYESEKNYKNAIELQKKRMFGHPSFRKVNKLILLLMLAKEYGEAIAQIDIAAQKYTLPCEQELLKMRFISLIKRIEVENMDLWIKDYFERRLEHYVESKDYEMAILIQGKLIEKESGWEKFLQLSDLYMLAGRYREAYEVLLRADLYAVNDSQIGCLFEKRAQIAKVYPDVLLTDKLA